MEAHIADTLIGCQALAERDFVLASDESAHGAPCGVHVCLFYHYRPIVTLQSDPAIPSQCLGSPPCRLT